MLSPRNHSSIFSIIFNIYGRAALLAARRWERLASRVSDNYCKLSFLHNCIKENLPPRSLRMKPIVDSLECHHAIRQFQHKTMRVLINDLHRRNDNMTRCVHNYREQCRVTLMTQHFQKLNQHIGWATMNVSQRATNKFRDRIEGLRKSHNNLSDKLVYNLSTKTLTQAQLALLRRDAGCNVMDAHALDFVAALEPALQHIEAGEEDKDAIRQQVTGLLINHRYHRILPGEELEALTQLKKDSTILVIPADKGRAMVVMDRAQYVCKALALLEDTTAYRIVSGDPMVTLKNHVNKVLNAIKRAKRLNNDTLARIRPSDTAIARFYGLPKVHKEGVPLRPIVSFKNTPTSSLAKWLSYRIGHLVNDSDTTVRSAEDFLDKIKNLRIEDDEVMVSFDVISLFTSIPQDLAIKTIGDLLHLRGLGQHRDSLRPDDLVDLLRLSLKTYFTFQGVTYEQIKGTPMGSPISSIIAEAVLQQLEHVAMAQYRPKFWARYVDDTFVVIKKSRKTDFVDILNSVCVDIQFTEEVEHQSRLAFLDVLIHRQPDGTLRTKVYRKPTHTDRILHFHSNHPVAHKVSCVRTLFKRVDSHCNTARARAEEKQHLFRICKRNGYLAKFIKRHGTLSRPPNSLQTGASPSQTTRVTLPYVNNVSEATARLMAPYNIKIAHKPNRTLRSLVMKPKDPLPTVEKSGVVYRINCSNCPSNYVGETAKRVKTRIQEHKLAIRRGECYSQMLTHMVESGHEFDFDGVKVVANDATKSGRLIKEAWLSCEGAINRHIDLRPAHAALRAWETHTRASRSKQSSNIDFTPLLQRINPRNNRRRLRIAPPPPVSLAEIEAPRLPDDRHTPSAPIEASDCSGFVPCRSSADGCPRGMVETPQDRAMMCQSLVLPYSPYSKAVTPPMVTWEGNTVKSPTSRVVTRSRTAIQRTGKDSMATGLHPILKQMRMKGEKHQLDGTGRWLPRDKHTNPSDGRQGWQAIPQDELRTGARENSMQQLEATPLPSVKGELPLPYTSEELRTPIVREASDSSGVAICPLRSYGCPYGRVEASQDRTTMGQPPGPLDSPHLKGVTPPTKTWVERTTKPPSPRVTRSQTAEQRTGSTAIGLHPAAKRMGTGRGKHHLNRIGGQSSRDMHTAPLDDRRGLRIDPQNDLGTIVRRKGRTNMLGERDDGSESGGGRRPITMKPREEERREQLDDNDGVPAHKEMVYPPTLCVRGNEGVATSIQDDECKLANCVKANMDTVIGRVGPLTRSRSRAQAPTQL